MLLAENMTALAAFALCAVAFVLGYILRNWLDGARAEWTEYAAYRQGDQPARCRR